MSRTDKITILEVEAVELVAGLLRIHYVLIDHEGRSLGTSGNALANLAAKERKKHVSSWLPELVLSGYR